MSKVSIVIMIILSVFSFNELIAQDTSERAKERKERKQEEERIYRENLADFTEWINSRDFVVLADNISGRYGSVYNVHPTVNFIEVDGERITIQTSHPLNTGYNGLGGVTTSGQINGVELFEKEKGKPISMIINFTTPLLGASTLNIHVNGNGNTSAYLRGIRGSTVTFRGEFAQADSSHVFQGMQVY